MLQHWFGGSDASHCAVFVAARRRSQPFRCWPAGLGRAQPSKRRDRREENLVLSDRLNEHLREKNRLVEENFQLKLKLSRAEDSGDGGDAKWTGAPGGFSLFAATKAAQAQAVP